MVTRSVDDFFLIEVMVLAIESRTKINEKLRARDRIDVHKSVRVFFKIPGTNAGTQIEQLFFLR